MHVSKIQAAETKFWRHVSDSTKLKTNIHRRS